MSKKSVLLHAALLGLVVGCGGGESRSPVLEEGGDSPRPSDGPGGTLADAGADPEEVVGAPRVTLTQPEDLESPDEGVVLTQDEVTVLCHVEQGDGQDARPVDASTVRIEMFTAQTDPADAAVGVATDQPGEFSATFVVAALESGPVSFRCLASDTSEPVLTGASTSSNFIDHGPAIAISSPALNSAHALEGAVPFNFTVTPQPLSDDDSGAAVDSVSLAVNGVAIDLEPYAETAGSYDFALDLSDETLFPNPPSGSISVLVTAHNSRAPAPGVRRVNHPFVIDGSGPVIQVLQPQANTVIGGEVVLQFEVADGEAGSGVDQSTVAVTLGGVEHFHDPAGAWAVDGDNYSFRFDSTNLIGVAAQLTVNIRASDNAGNESIGQSHLLYLDNFPPIVDLDPGNFRVYTGSPAECSVSFDPLGNAVNHPDSPAYAGAEDRAALFRALVWDTTNSSPGQTILYMAGANRNSVRLYLQQDAGTPLVVDSNGDGVCDEIANADSLDFVSLGPINKQGTPLYGPDELEAPVPEGCSVREDPSTPTFLCTSQASDMTYVIQHTSASLEPVVYGAGTLQGIECTGVGWELGAFVDQDGWVCLAARATDNVGNVGVSRPLPVCLDDFLRPGSPDCATMSVAVPDCTDACELPPAFDSVIIPG